MTTSCTSGTCSLGSWGWFALLIVPRNLLRRVSIRVIPSLFLRRLQQVRKVLGKDRRTIRKIKDDKELNEDTRLVQEREKERAKWQKSLDESGNAAFKDNGIINPYADVSSQIRINPVLSARLKPHQVEGVRFLWQRLMDGRAPGAAGGLGSLQALKEGDIGTGCVLAHNMGLGKTFQVITFLHTICLSCPENIELRRMLVLGPVNTLYNWKAELARWLPDEGKLPDGTYIEVFLLDESGRTNQLRVQTLESWFKRGGIMCMGYEMYRNLAQGNRVKEKVLKAKLERYLRDPGPGIVIADEGHMLRNHKSNISKEVARIKTRRRAVLTGSPLQNNLSEYHCMIDFINPGFLGSLAEFKNRFETPIMNGESVDASDYDVKLMKMRNHVLTKQLQPMVQRKDFTPLVTALPPKFEFTLQIRLSDLQKKLYNYAATHRGQCGITGVFTAYHILMKIWNHPAVLWKAKLQAAEKDNKDNKNG
eukprot:CAMPEP_0180233160 /NCGR_PEP_ID=MMETSP0987-20121128/27912_1 /TAXON_ID=697907 /ORGANISM="non described non described, Strain CCMP2293" /LENGTH=477 /DNA_ID=CAMNT_0022198929 /DNA_START=166 /DNA_END=1597 /DNA_ORIENTATION=-